MSQFPNAEKMNTTSAPGEDMKNSPGQCILKDRNLQNKEKLVLSRESDSNTVEIHGSCESWYAAMAVTVTEVGSRGLDHSKL